MPVQNNRGRSGKQVEFSFHETKRVVGSFDGPQISSLGGIILVAELEHALGLVCGAAQALVDFRIRPRYTACFLLLQRVLLICCGLEKGIQSNYYRHDPAILTAMGLNISTDQLASQSLISSFETRMDSKNCYRLAMYLLTFYIQTRRTLPKEIILDLDGSCFPVHGKQQGSAYRGHYETDMYFPLLVFDQDGWLITAILRPGDEGEARLAIPVLKRIVSAFRQAWPCVRIVVRADAGFNDPRLYDWCEDQGKDEPRNTVYYLIRMKRPPKENGPDVHISHIRATAQRTFRRKFGPERYLGEPGKKQKNAEQSEILKLPRKERYATLAARSNRKVRLFADFRYQAGNGKKRWRHERRVIGIIDHSDIGGEHAYLVTNIPHDPPNYLYERQYCKRGKAEAFIHELKSLHATRLSCHDFFPNQFRLLQYVLAYLLLFKLRECLPESCARMSLGSIRDNFIKVAVVVRVFAHMIRLQWTAHYFWRDPFLFICSRLQKIPIRS